MKFILFFITFSSLSASALEKISDKEIVTASDLLFCSSQKVKNQNISPQMLPDDGSIWRVGNNRWNKEWEAKYSDWVQTNMTYDVFRQLEMETDCGEAALFIRAIFARIYNLPVNFKGGQFSHRSLKFKNIKSFVRIWDPTNWMQDFKKDKRFQKAIKSWGAYLGTVHFHKDTYPVKIFNTKFDGPSEKVKSGAIWLTSGHVETLRMNSKTSLVAPYKVMGSTYPRGPHYLSRNYFSLKAADGLDIALEKNKIPKTGLLAWNWDINCKGSLKKVDDKKMDGYSLEQYTYDWDQKPPSFFNLNQSFLKKLGLTKEKKDELIRKEVDSLLQNIRESIEIRIKSMADAIVEGGKRGVVNAKSCFHTIAKFTESESAEYAEYLINKYGNFIPTDEMDLYDPDHVPFFSTERINDFDFSKGAFKAKSQEMKDFYYTYSTPNRDRRLGENWRSIEELLKGLENKGEDIYLQLMNETAIQINENKSISLFHSLKALAAGAASPQPWDSPEKRWGEELMKDTHQLYSKILRFSFTHKSILEMYKKSPTDRNLKYLQDFESEYRLKIEEKSILDQYFKKD